MQVMSSILKKLGIEDQMKATLKAAQGGAGAMKMAASGELEMAWDSEKNEPVFWLPQSGT